MQPSRKPLPLEPRFDTEVLKELTAQWRAECGARVKTRREVLNLHRRELADLADTTEPTIVRIEAGTMNPSDRLRIAIAGVLRCEVDTLWAYPTHSHVEARALAIAS